MRITEAWLDGSARIEKLAVATFVLVHGAWHGGWCWKRVAPALRAAGHDVYTPTLTGLGERAHLANPSIGLETHVQDIVNVLNYEELREVILVGHSYGGLVITGVADRQPDRLAHLVYLDAFVPRPGQSLFDIRGVHPDAGLESSLHPDWRMPPLLPIFGVTNEQDLAWLVPKLVNQPTATFRDRLEYSTPLEERAFARTYIWAKNPTSGFAATAEGVRNNPAWRYRELETGHDVMVTKPAELVELLLEAAV